MTPQQVLMSCNSQLKQLTLQIRASQNTYYLEVRNDLLQLVKRNSAKGGNNLRKQVVIQQAPVDPFLDSGINHGY